MPEEQSVNARDGVADPHGCGNPLRSGIAGLATAPDSQPPATHFPDPPLRPQTPRPSPQSDTQIPTRKACCARRAKRPRQGWRGRSARMRESFAIGHCGPFDGSRLTATSHFPDLPLTPQTPRPSPQSDTQIQQERPAVPEEQSVHARDGVADPHGCGNPLRSGTAGLATAPDSQPSAISHQPSAISHPFSRPASKTSNTTPIPSKRHPNPNKKGLLCPKSKASTPGMAWPIRMDAGILCDRATRAFRRLPTHSHQLPATSYQLPAISHKLSAPCNLPITHKKKRQAGFPLTCRFCNEPQLTPDKLLFVFSRVVFVFCIRFRRNLFIVNLCFRRDIFLAFRHATVD
ncbi:hypothetical protein DAPPPG734_06360 [Pantoea agglomerans]|uniref:Uncharacterized protein n=1 Tax=Enterobacter agglomerans TaxID=549 RepID=A0AAN2K538_ENTAG|nr:hypothetical protein DAPPPG734_06360 [Pantoea agglomerans]